MDHDDRPVGRILTRREVLALMGVTGAALAAYTFGQTSEPPPACVVSPEMTEGPYFVDERLNRSDIRADTASGELRPGAPLTLDLRVLGVGAGGCAPLGGAMVDLWHCDAAGVYSDVRDRGSSTVGQDFLRGYQLTDADGVARFTTIYPGWYPGRAVHIHFKIRQDAGGGRTREFTSQFFFDDAFTEGVYGAEPYASHGLPNTPNARDGIFQRGGPSLILPVAASDDGYAASFDIGVQS